MTPRQKRIIAALVIANGVVILALAVLATHLSGTTFSSPLPRPYGTMPRSGVGPYGTMPHPTAIPGALPQETCQLKAAQLLAQAGLGGTVTLTAGESLRFEIVYPLAPGHTADEAAQQVWTAFDVALALEEERCGVFSQVEVTILAVRPDAHGEAQGVQDDTRISASVSAVNLGAFSAGELGEDKFIERVSYTTSIVNE